MIRSSLGLGGILLALGTSAVVFACSSSTDDSTTPPAVQSTSSAVSGPADSHCGGMIVKVNPAACTMSDADAGPDAGADETDTNDFGDTMYGSMGNDDDCKYHVSWTSTPASVGNPVTFVVTATNLFDNTPTTGANPYIEAFLDERTPAPNSNPQTSEGPPGTYTIGPIEFSSPGQWTVRFHFAGTCEDSADSPHGHAAFYVAVP